MSDLLDSLAPLFWEHPRGDVTTLPCTHVVYDHPRGHEIRTPCTHGLVQEHPGGDPLTTPCTHLVPVHAGGHDVTAPCIHGVTQTHPEGDWAGFVRVLCIHLSLVHPAGDRHNIPCPHLRQEHPEGDTIFLPCRHLRPVHSRGDVTVAPCVHVRQAHPAGHPGPHVPCVHPLPIRRSEFDGRLLFYTDDAEIQGSVIAIVEGLIDLGIDVTVPRSLHVFHRPPLNGDPNDNLDPFWSHYNPFFHAIQLTAGHSSERNLDTALHELGHAILGHSLPNHFAWGPHTGTTPNLHDDGTPNMALAMSEGWADFVALALEDKLHLGSEAYKAGVLEDLKKLLPHPATDRCVAAALWDLFDPHGSETTGKPDRVSLPFTDLFRVYSPTLETLMNGPVVSSIYDFCARLKSNAPRNSSLALRIDDILDRNVGPKP